MQPGAEQRRPDPSDGGPWWRGAVVYQVYPRSFADADGDGVGDLEGLRQHLDHVASLGVDAVWLSPIYRSPMADFGYDVADYRDVDPLFGSLADLDRLVAEAHERGLRVLLDWVPNHSSDQHPWFVESRSSRTNPKRDWYVWRDPGPDGGPPNNWIRAWGGTPAWTFDEPSGQWYLHQFLPEQPDLNWANPEVVEAMHDVLRFWLDRGVDGFRIDVIHGLGRDVTQDDPVPPGRSTPLPHCVQNDHPSTHELIRGFRRLLDGYPGDRVMVGEVFLLDTAKVGRYYGDDDELHLAFNFPPLFAPWRADAWREQLEACRRHIEDVGGWPTWVLSNHDVPRHRTRYGSLARAHAAAVLLLSLRGTAFVYAGEELGLEDGVIPPERVVDPGGRDGCRSPLPWSPGGTHGWGPEPWLPFPPDADARNAEVLEADPRSILHLYRRVIAERRRSPALRSGTWERLDAPDEVLAVERRDGDDVRVLLVNFTDRDVACAAEGTVVVASDGRGEGARYAGTLGPDQAVLLAP